MSHFTTIQTQIRDLDALNDACVEMNLKLASNARCRGYAGVTRLAPHVIQLKAPYDVTVDPSPERDGSYGLTTDWWDGHAAKEVGTPTAPNPSRSATASRSCPIGRIRATRNTNATSSRPRPIAPGSTFGRTSPASSSNPSNGSRPTASSISP